MASPRDVRRCALQALYQFDAGAEPHDAARALEDSPGSSEAHDDGITLATEAWA